MQLYELNVSFDVYKQSDFVLLTMERISEIKILAALSFRDNKRGPQFSN